MKVIYNIAGTYRPAGMERVLANKVRWLSEHDYEVVVVTTDQRGRSPFFELPYGVRTIDLGINYEENNGGSFMDKLAHYPGKQIRHKKALEKVLKAEKADVVVSMFCNDAGFLPDIKDGSKKVLEIHFSKFKRLQYGRKGLWALADRFRSWTDGKHIRKFDKFVVLTHEDKGYWGDQPNITVIPNACTFAPTRHSPLDTKKVVAVSRLCYQKGYDRMIDAWRIVKDDPQSEGWTLEIVGDGDLKSDIQAQVDRLGLSDSVRLEPPTNNMDSVYLGASLLVLSSRYEGLPMVLLEAQAYGVPVVSFDCKCGPKDVISDGVNGYLAPDGDIKALAEKIIAVMSDDTLRHNMGVESLRMSADYTQDHIMQQWDKLFNELCAGR